MKKIDSLKICPHCNKAYNEPSAISRFDNQTAICPDCGTREALESLGVSESEQEKIVEIIHKNYKPN